MILTPSVYIIEHLILIHTLYLTCYISIKLTTEVKVVLYAEHFYIY